MIYSSVDKAEFPTADLLFSCWFWGCVYSFYNHFATIFRTL